MASPLSRRLPDGDNDNGRGWQAHRLGTLINLYSGGYRKVEDLEVGDELISDNGDKTEVVNAWRAKHLIYEIKTTQGKYYYTPEHPLKVVGKEYVKVKDLKIGDRLEPYYITTNERKTELSDEDLTLLGFWLGDGYVDYSDRYTPKYAVVVNDKKKAYLDNLTDRITWSKHSNGKAWQGYIRKGGGVEDNTSNGKESLLHEYLAKCGRYSYGKEVPFELSLAEREKVLEGYLTADGYARLNNSGYTLETTSESLARWTQETAWALGKNASLILKREAGTIANFGVSKHDLYRINISKENFDRHTDGGFKITGIELLGEEETVHIEVNGNHTYVAENIKVHNCSKYAYYLATGIRMNYKPHPDYGPCNGRDMVNYLIRNCGYEACGKQAGAIFAYNTSGYGHCGMVINPNTNQVNDANWTPKRVSTHTINLDAVRASYCRPKGSSPSPGPSSSFLPAKGYWGYGDNDPRVGKLASFMRSTFPAYTPAAALGNYYGKNLKSSIATFQKKTGLASDGNTGPITYRKLQQYGFKG